MTNKCKKQQYADTKSQAEAKNMQTNLIQTRYTVRYFQTNMKSN